MLPAPDLKPEYRAKQTQSDCVGGTAPGHYECIEPEVNFPQPGIRKGLRSSLVQKDSRVTATTLWSYTLRSRNLKHQIPN
jgi:hypothetical protein